MSALSRTRSSLMAYFSIPSLDERQLLQQVGLHFARERREADRHQRTAVRRIRLSDRDVRDALEDQPPLEQEKVGLVLRGERHGVRSFWQRAGAGLARSMDEHGRLHAAR